MNTRPFTYISEGNSKVGDIPSVSIMPVVTCAPGVPCAKGCYAVNICRRSKDAKRTWQQNTDLLMSDRTQYFDSIAGYLQWKQPRFFRWHVGGDIFDQDYYDRMVALARAYPLTRYLAFTKRYELSFADRPNNLSIVASLWPEYGDASIPLPKAYMQDGRETRYQESEVIPCPGNCETCGMCWSLAIIGKDVVFTKH